MNLNDESRLVLIKKSVVVVGVTVLVISLLLPVVSVVSNFAAYELQTLILKLV